MFGRGLGRAYGRRRRRYRRSQTMPKPMNDLNNFFFEPENCGQYEVMGYRPQQNYSIQEAAQVIDQINKEYTIQPFWYYLVFCGPCICCILALYIADVMVGTCPVLMLFCIGLMCLQNQHQTNIKRLQQFFYSINQTLHMRNVHWQLKEEGFIHLCIDFPTSYRPFGAQMPGMGGMPGMIPGQPGQTIIVVQPQQPFTGQGIRLGSGGQQQMPQMGVIRFPQPGQPNSNQYNQQRRQSGQQRRQSQGQQRPGGQPSYADIMGY